MKVDVHSNHKCCASCFYWSGCREIKPNSYGMQFTVENFNSVKTVGTCTCGQSRYASRSMPANNVPCSYYQKWYALK